MTTIRALLIGGPHDGDWISVLDHVDSVVLPGRPRTTSYASSAQQHTQSVDRILYRREILSEGQRKHVVFYCGEHGQLIETLLNGYRNPGLGDADQTQQREGAR